MSMFDYIKKMLEEFASYLGWIAKTPVANHMFTTNEKYDILDEDKAQLFHHLGYLCKHTRQDIQTVKRYWVQF